MEKKLIGGRGNDRYGFGKRFRAMSDDQLVEAFNREVGKPGWVSARADYLAMMCREFLSRRLDSSSFIKGNRMSLAHRIIRVGPLLVPE